MPAEEIIGAAGAIGGGLISAYGNYKAQQAERRARQKAADELRAQGVVTDNEYKKIIQGIDQYYQDRGSLGTAQDVNEYKAAIAEYNPEEAGYAPEKTFDETYSKSKEDFLNPYYGAIIADTADQIQHTAAGAGIGRGTGAALNIAKGTAEKSDELYRTAMNEMNQDRSFAYQKYQDAITNNQNRLNAINQSKLNKIGLQGNLANDYYNTMDQAQADRIAAEQDRLNARTSYNTAMAGLY